MQKILASEWIKQKGNRDSKLLIFIPFVTVFIAFLLAGPAILESFSIYWWEALFLFTLTGLLFLNDYKAEEVAGDFQNVQMGSRTFKIYLSKIVLTLKNLLISSVMVVGVLYLVSFLFPQLMSLNIQVTLLTLLLMILASIWVLPMLYYLSVWLNPYLLLAGNSLICLLIAPFIAQTPVWYLFPYTYHYKVAQALLYLKPSGDVEATSGIVNGQTVIIAVTLSLILFTVLMAALRKEKND